MSKRQGGEISGWFRQYVYSSMYPEGTYVIVGFVSGDTNWPDGSQLRTSPILYQTETEVETKNTIYKLGDRLCPQDTTTYRRKSKDY